MIRLILLALLFFSLIPVSELYSQVINIDSLEVVTQEKEATPVDLVQAHNRLSRYYLTNDTTKANYHLLQLDSIASAEVDTNAMFLAGDLKMRKLISKGQYKEGEAEVRNQIKLAKALEKDVFIIGSYNAMGVINSILYQNDSACLLYTSPSPRDQRGSRMPSSA